VNTVEELFDLALAFSKNPCRGATGWEFSPMRAARDYGYGHGHCPWIEDGEFFRTNLP